MTWFALTGDSRLGRCATKHCGGQPTARLEADGVGSNYCSGCRAEIERSRPLKTHGSLAEFRKERMAEQEAIIRQMLAGFVADHPDSPYQEGFLCAVLTIANEVFGIHYTDPLWASADALVGGDDPKYAEATRKQALSKRAPFQVIDGGKTTPDRQGVRVCDKCGIELTDADFVPCDQVNCGATPNEN